MEVKKDILTIEEQQAKLLKKMRRMDMIRQDFWISSKMRL